MEDKLYWYWLCGKVLLPIKRQKELMDVFIHPKELYKINPEIIKECLTELEYQRFLDSRDETQIKKDYESMMQKEIRFITVKEAAYPNRLRKIYDAPYGIFQKGQPYEEKELSIAIVGSRYPTTYGLEITKMFAKELAKAGVQIISGLAKGIDGAAHRAVVDEKGQAVGVLGCGIDLIYPKQNFQLFYDMYENQTVISEYPPGSEPLKWHFPERNRIISGLSDGILVTEAKERSGSLITVDCGLDQNKEVFAVPGMITEKHSRGCHGLIKQGAKLVENIDDILTEFSEFTGFSRKFPNLQAKSLAMAEKRVYDMLSLKPKHIDEIVSTSKYSYEEVIKALFQLEAKGYIKQTHQNLYIKKI